jgi:hypothetical protein
VIAHYGIHEVIWMTVPLLLLAFGMSFITEKAPQQTTLTEIEEISEPESLQVAVSE